MEVRVQIRMRRCEGADPFISDHARRGKQMKCARKLLWFFPGWSVFGAIKPKRSLQRSSTMCTGFGLLELNKCRQVHVQQVQLVLTANGDKRKQKNWSLDRLRSVEVGKADGCKCWRSDTVFFVHHPEGSQMRRTPRHWKIIRQMPPSILGNHTPQPSKVDEFGHMLAELFQGNPPPIRPMILLTWWTLQEFHIATNGMNKEKVAGWWLNRCCMFQMNSWQAFGVVQHLAAHRDIPTSSPKTVFQMLAKKVRALQRSDFRPIANIRVFYTAFVFMILAWMEPILESHQPEEYLGFRMFPSTCPIGRTSAYCQHVFGQNFWLMNTCLVRKYGCFQSFWSSEMGHPLATARGPQFIGSLHIIFAGQ